MCSKPFISYCSKWLQIILFVQIHNYIELLPKSEFKFNGKFASVGELQHVVYIQINKFTICSGAIINESWILSAAHCFINNDEEVSPKDVEVSC